MSSNAASASVPRATSGKQKAIAPGMTPDNLPISTVTRVTFRPCAASATSSTMLQVMASSCMDERPSTDTRQLLSDQHVDDALSAKYSMHGDASWLPGDGAADNAGGPAERMRLHGRECVLRLFVWNDRDDLAFVGKIKRIEPENLAKAPHLVAKRGRGLVDFDGKLRGLGNLVEDGRHAAAGGITDESRRRGSG